MLDEEKFGFQADNKTFINEILNHFLPGKKFNLLKFDAKDMLKVQYTFMDESGIVYFLDIQFEGKLTLIDSNGNSYSGDKEKIKKIFDKYYINGFVTSEDEPE
jgi:hypothetical protein